MEVRRGKVKRRGRLWGEGKGKGGGGGGEKRWKEEKERLRGREGDRRESGRDRKEGVIMYVHVFTCCSWLLTFNYAAAFDNPQDIS